MEPVAVGDRVANQLVIQAILVWIISCDHDDLPARPPLRAELPVGSDYFFAGTALPLAPKNIAKQSANHPIENLVRVPLLCRSHLVIGVRVDIEYLRCVQSEWLDERTDLRPVWTAE